MTGFNRTTYLAVLLALSLSLGCAGADGSGSPASSTSGSTPPGSVPPPRDTVDVDTEETSATVNGTETGCSEPTAPLNANGWTTTASEWSTVAAHTVELPGREAELDRCANVERIETSPIDGGGLRHVVHATADGHSSTFIVNLASNIPLPFGVGDRIGVHVRVRRIRIHQVIEARITDTAGQLLIAVSEDGNAALAPGWTVEVGDVLSRLEPHMRGGARRESRALQIGYAGERARIAEDVVRIDTAQHHWLVSGHATTWTEGVLPPDAASYSSFSIIRLTQHE